MKSRGDDENSIFNFSFLDILSATIGALIFILLMIVISTTNLVERKIVDEVKRQHTEALEELEESQKEIS